MLKIEKAMVKGLLKCQKTIMLVCSAGMSTSLLVTKMQKQHLIKA